MKGLKKGIFDFLSTGEKKEIVIFGIGTNAAIINEICIWKNITVNGYIISDDVDSRLDKFKGAPVYKISQCNDQFKKNTVILAVREGKIKQKVLGELENGNFEDVVCAKDYLEWLDILTYFYSKYFTDKGIDIQSEILDIYGNKIINGLRFDDNGRYAFLISMGDIILPKYFNDYNICSEGPYELEETGVRLKAGDVVLDFGANMGMFSAVALNEGCKVYAFEPTPSTRDYLEKNKKINSDNFVIEPYALSNEVGETDFYLDSNVNTENSISNLSECAENIISVQMTTLDSFVEESNLERVDFIKADIEGAERYMLLGGIKTLKKYAPKLAICTYHLKDDPEVLENIIKNANPHYKIIHKYKKLYAYVE
jgi:FkbM family methyltransferase